MFGIWSFLRQFMYTKFIIVTDEDINVRDWKDVIWAVSTRMDPRAIALLWKIPRSITWILPPRSRAWAPRSGLTPPTNGPARPSASGRPITMRRSEAAGGCHVERAGNRLIPGRNSAPCPLLSRFNTRNCHLQPGPELALAASRRLILGSQNGRESV